MRTFSKVRRARGTLIDPYHVVPIPPKSVVRFAPGRSKHGWEIDIGKIYRIGYYGHKDGLDCIWLVDDHGEYAESVDHEFLFKNFDIIVVSDETDLYGKDRVKLPPIRVANQILKSKNRT